MIIGYAELTVRGKLMEIGYAELTVRAKPKVLFCTKLFRTVRLNFIPPRSHGERPSPNLSLLGRGERMLYR